MKYRDRPSYGDSVAALMVARLLAAAGPGTGELPGWDLVVPVPMYLGKKEKRGYNQAEIIGRGLAKRLGLPYRANVLKRNRETELMSKLSLDERKQNLTGAIILNSAFEKTIPGSSVLLVDDVYTTGSTADACAMVLKNAGCAPVDLITFAIGADVNQKSAQDIVSGAEHF